MSGICKNAQGASVSFTCLKTKELVGSQESYAALTRRRLAWGNPSVETKRICLGGGIKLPPGFEGEWWLIASFYSSVIPKHWAFVGGNTLTDTADLRESSRGELG